MRIIFILHQFYPEFSGGTEHVVFNLARCFQRAGHYVHVLACTMRSASYKGPLQTKKNVAIHEIHQSIPVTLIPREHLPALGDLGFDVAPAIVDELRDWIRAQRFDLMHLFHTMRMSSAVLAAQQCELPYVATLTDFFFSCYRINTINVQGSICNGPQEGHACERDCLVPPWTKSTLISRYQQAHTLLQTASERVVPSEYVAKHFRNAFPAMSWRVIPHGVDFLNLLTTDPLSTRTNQSQDSVTLGYLGSIIQKKGLHILLQALANVSSPRLKLRIIGEFYGDPVYKSDILHRIKEDPRVEWVGHVAPTAVANELKQIDLLCLPSLIPETFSLVLHEAAALQIPALVSDLGAPGQFVTEQGSGQTIVASDIDAWSQALRKIINDPEQLNTWRANVRMPYRIEEEAFFYESLYRQFVVQR